MTLQAVRPRDFIETGDGLYLAVVSPLQDAGRYLTSLRYHTHDGRLHKLDTAAATALLRDRHSGWLARSAIADAVLHLVPASAVAHVHRPDDHLAALLASPPRPHSTNPVPARAVAAVHALAAHGARPASMGISGSLLLGVWHPGSDIDLVAYGREAFALARTALGAAVAAGTLEPLSDADWQDAWERRGRPLTLDEYQWHEQRKGTKARIEDTRIDLSLVAHAAEQDPLPRGVRKLGRDSIVAPVTGAVAAFDHPARYAVDHAELREVLSFTPTYAGQAQAGETLEAAGWVEEDELGVRRLVVGTSREAAGEWIRVRAL